VTEYTTVNDEAVLPVRVTLNAPVVRPASVAVASMAAIETLSLLAIVTVALR
jgi:hypothetical protein